MKELIQQLQEVEKFAEQGKQIEELLNGSHKVGDFVNGKNDTVIEVLEDGLKVKWGTRIKDGVITYG